MWKSKEDIVVSGISGKFPESDDVDEFIDNLYANRDLVVEDERRYPFGFLGLPKGSGKLKDISRFDAHFFGITDTEAHLMDAQIRIMLELTYEAIWDAGIDPNCLSGTNTGIFIGNCFDEAASAQAENYSKIFGYKQHFSGIISQIFNFSGPSMLVDTACASSFCAFHKALNALRSNRCDRAIVVGINMSLRPITQLQFYKLNMISPEGHCKCLDSEANGYTKGEACVVTVLQKKSEAKRMYATIVHTKTNTDGFKELGITFPSSSSQRDLMCETYKEANINPNNIKFIEAHCTGTQAGDPVEMSAILDAMCSDRKEPLLIGALKSIIGHTEGSSGLCSLTKVIFCFENQCIPANLHMKTPNPKIEGLVTGILKPITENTPFTDKLVGLNCFGFGGANVHVIVRSDSKEPSKDNTDIFNGIPRLVLMCGRTEEALHLAFDKIGKTPKMLTRDYLSLLNDISKTSAFKNDINGFQGMTYRGFTIKYQNTSIEDTNNLFISEVPETRRQIWYVFSGMGSQWPEMAKSLMNLKVFAQSIKKSVQILNEYDYNLTTILLDNNEKLMDCPLNCFTSLAAIQIALVDVLNELDITPDGIVGHSAGELVCGYADRCLTHEETIRMAYWRGMIIKEGIKWKGRMAAIGLSVEEVKLKLNDDIYLACHNSEDSVTVSGEDSAVSNFIKQMNDLEVFARSVDSTGIAFHTPLISGIKQPLIEKLSKIIPTKRLKSSKWLSTTYVKSDERSEYISCEYFSDNMILPVLFSEALRQIPRNAVVIEVSPHHLLQAILKKSLGFDMTYIPLMKRNENNIKFILENVGKLYTTGVNPSIEKLYPKVEYPVSRGTPTISPMIKWDHNKSYTVYQFPHYFNPIGSTDFAVKVDLQDQEDSYLSGHCIDGRILFPATSYLLLAWKQLAKQLGVNYDELPVEFENVSLHRATILPKVGVTKFDVRILETSGQFIITESGTVAVTGRIFSPQIPCNQFDYLLDEVIDKNKNLFDDSTENVLKSEDIYKELRLRGYDYGKSFQCLTKAVVNSERVKATIKWTNWVSFVDSMIQTAILGKKSRGLYLPVRIDSLKCDPRLLSETTANNKNGVPVLFDYCLGIGVSKGVEFRGMKANLGPRKVFSRIPLLEEYRFVPYNEVCPLKSTDKEIVTQYMKQCYELALNLSKKFNFCLKEFEMFDESIQTIVREQSENEKKSVENDLNNSDNTNSNDDENRCLLQLLMELNSNQNNIIDEKMLEELNEKLLRLDYDLLNECFKREDFIRQQLETVIENNYNKNRINILEVNQNQSIIAQTVIQMLGLSTFDMKISYNLLHPMVSKLNSDLINEVECHHWIVEKSRLPSELNDYDLILYEDRIDLISTQSIINLSSLFDSFCNSIKDNGFLIVFYKNILNFGEEVLAKIVNELQNDDNNNKHKNITNNHLIERKNQIINEAEKVGFSLIANKIDDISKGSLIFRKICSDIRVENQTFIRITNDKCEQWIEKLQNSLKSIEGRPNSDNIWLLGDGSPSNGIIGLVNCLRREPNGQRIRCIFEYDFQVNQNSNILENKKLLETIVKKNLVFNVLKSDNISGSFRHFSIDWNQNTIPAQHCYLNVQTKGDLSSFKWFEAQHKYWPLGKKNNEQLIDVYYSPLNFRDIMLATGKLSADALPDDMGLQDCILGLEFAGRDQNGNRVMGMTPSKGLATTIVMEDMDFVWPIPEHWSMEEASTVPVVYATAYYALIIRGKLRPKESVLIHSGSGGVGQAAIAICLSMECQLFITCGSASKREFLKNEFSPNICDENFWTSRDSSFELFIMRETNGRGVDLVLNSLSEDKLQSSVRCLATGGRFLEIGKYDLSQNNDLGMSRLLRNKTFHGILLDSLFIDESKCSAILRSHKQLVRRLIENGITNGIVRPLKRTVFDSSQVEQAFRFMASGKHIGKVVLKIRDESMGNIGVSFPSLPRTVFKPNKSYIIIGGLGGFGLELANWMIERGAANLVLTSRTGIRTAYQKSRISYFEELGVNVKISTKDVSDLNQTRHLIQLATNLGTSEGVGGIFNLALVLSDGLFENQTPEQFERVFTSKAKTVHNLDIICRDFCPNLDYFVCFSSVACGRGNSGQSNYGFANSVMERVCEQRKSSGLSGLAIQWGAIGDVGVVAENMGGNDIIIGGTLPQRMPSCLATLDAVLQMKYTVVSSIVKSDHKIEASNKKENLIKTIANILGLKDYMNLDSNLTLAELGMDSLMSVEVKQTLDIDYEVVLSMPDIRRLSVSRILSIGQKDVNKTQTETLNTEKQLLSNNLMFEIPVESFTYLNDVKNGKPVLLLPPLEGSFKLLTDLAKRMNRPVIGLNWTNGCQHLNTIEETAEYYLKIVSDKLNDCFVNSCDLIGYSFGGCVAYEMAVQLQRKWPKISTKLIFLDSSPVQFQIYAQNLTKKYQLSDHNSQQLESLIAFLNQYVSVDYNKVKLILENTPVVQRVDRVSQIFLESQQIETNPENVEFIAKTFSNKLLMLNTYDVHNKASFDGNTLLIRAQDVIIKNDELIKPDYGLSEIISGKCETFVMEGNHLSFLYKNIHQISTLINNYLD